MTVDPTRGNVLASATRIFLSLYCAALLAGCIPSRALGDVFQWQWVDPSDPSRGKIQSSTLCPEGAGATAGPGSILSNRDLTLAYLASKDLSYSYWYYMTLTDAYVANADLYQMFLYGSSATGADFSGVDAHTTNFRFTDLTRANFTGANLRAAKLDYCTLDEADFSNADLSNGSMLYSSFYKANFSNANITGVHFDGAASKGFTQEQLRSTASYKNHDLRGIWFGSYENLNGWDFSGGIDLSEANFTFAKLAGAKFSAGTLALTDFLGADLSSADFSGAKLPYAYFEGAVARKATFVGADLSSANVSADLTDANLRSANLTNAQVGAALAGADLTDAIISGASFVHARGLAANQIYSTASYRSHDLRGIYLSGFVDDVDMTGWDFSSQNLTNAVVGGATLAGASFRNANLTNAAVGGLSLDGADFSGATIIGAALSPISAQQLYSTASYQAHDLRGVRLGGNDMSGWDLSGVDLTNADFTSAKLPLTNLSGTTVTGVDFSRTTDRGFSAQQLYSTASYKLHDLRGTRYDNDDLSGWDFRGTTLSGGTFRYATLRRTDLSATSLANADFQHAVLTDADLTLADLSGADLSDADLRGARNADLTGASTTNAILPDGTIAGLQPDYTIPTIRNYTGSPSIPVHVTGGWDVRNTVEILFDDKPWNSTISFDPGIPIRISGTNLQLEFEQGVDGSMMIGETFRVFDWTGVTPDGEFRIYSQFWIWDTSQLYTNGTVTLVSEIPEPACNVLTFIGAGVFLNRRIRPEKGVILPYSAIAQ